jgi:hypothetical protein
MYGVFAGIQGMAPSNKQQGFGAGCLTDPVSCNLYTTHLRWYNAWIAVILLGRCHTGMYGCLVTNKTNQILHFVELWVDLIR